MALSLHLYWIAACFRTADLRFPTLPSSATSEEERKKVPHVLSEAVRSSTGLTTLWKT